MTDMKDYFSFDTSEYARIMKLARHPTWDEFKKVSAIAGAGILIVGSIGFAIFLVMRPLPP